MGTTDSERACAVFLELSARGIDQSSKRNLMRMIPCTKMNETENNGFGRLSKRRGHKAMCAAALILFVAIVCLLVCFFCWPTTISTCVFYLGFSFLLCVLGELLKRVFLLYEEFQHLDTRYKGSKTKALKATFAFHQWKVLLVLSGFATFFVFQAIFEHGDALNHKTNAVIFVVQVFVLPALGYLVGLRQASPIEESELRERENRNVADGLAWSFYFGYLKIVLPELDRQINESTFYRYKIDPRKLFILLPRNCFIRRLIKEADENVREDGDLPALKINQGGIKGRSYKHTVHKMADGGGVRYLVVEYCTSLKTLFDMSRDDIGALSGEERDQQVMIFTRKLKEILDKDQECRGKYELITLSGDKNNIAEILLRTIRDSSILLPH